MAYDIETFLLCERVIEANKVRDINELYKNRNRDGAFNLLVDRHLKEHDIEFREYFRLTPYEFNDVLRAIRMDIQPVPTNFITNPISAEHKLCLTLR